MSKRSDKIIAKELNLNVLNSQRRLTIANWSDSPCDLIDHDLLFGDKKIKKICYGFVIINIDNGKTTGGEKENYLGNFFSYLISKKCPNPMSELKKEVNNLLFWSQDIIDLCTQEINKNIEGRIANIIEMHHNSPMGDRLKIVSKLA